MSRGGFIATTPPSASGDIPVRGGSTMTTSSGGAPAASAACLSVGHAGLDFVRLAPMFSIGERIAVSFAPAAAAFADRSSNAALSPSTATVIAPRRTAAATEKSPTPA